MEDSKDTEFNLQKITYTNGTDIITMTPIDFFYVENLYPVIIYQLTYNDVSSNLTFYMSNGKTNGYRCNLLLPFLCFNAHDNYDSCPSSEKYNSYGLLYKISGCDNININIINDKIIKSVKNKNEIQQLYNFAQKGTGIITVLPRITDFAILILNLANPKITSLRIKNIDDIDERLYIPFDSANISESQYDIHTKQDFLTGIELSKISNINEINRISLEFRKYLTYKLYELSQYIHDEHFKIEYIHKPFSEFKKMSYSEFNKLMQICLNYDINPHLRSNYAKFSEISTQFANIYKTNTFSQKENELRDVITGGICKKIEDSFTAFGLTCPKKLDVLKFLQNLHITYQKILAIYNSIFSMEILNKLNTNNGVYFKFNLTPIGIENYKEINKLLRQIGSLLLNNVYTDQEEINMKIAQNIDNELYKFEHKQLNIFTYITDDNIEYYLKYIKDTYTKLEKLFENLYDSSYRQKYLKYKQKYIKLKNIVN